MDYNSDFRLVEGTIGVNQKGDYGSYTVRLLEHERVVPLWDIQTLRQWLVLYACEAA